MSDESTGGPDAAMAAMRVELKTMKAEVARLTPLEAEVARLAPFEAQANELGQQIATLSSRLDAASATHAEDLTMARMGFDDAGVIVARALHAAKGEEAGSFSDWLSGLTPDTAPTPMRPYLAKGAPVTAAVAQPAETGNAPAAPTPAPRPGANASGAAPASPGVTVDAIRAAREIAQKTGDWSQVKALNEAVRAEIAGEG